MSQTSISSLSSLSYILSNSSQSSSGLFHSYNKLSLTLFLLLLYSLKLSSLCLYLWIHILTFHMVWVSQKWSLKQIQGCEHKNRGQGVGECDREGEKVHEEDIIEQVAIVGNYSSVSLGSSERQYRTFFRVIST